MIKMKEVTDRICVKYRKENNMNVEDMINEMRYYDDIDRYYNWQLHTEEREFDDDPAENAA